MERHRGHELKSSAEGQEVHWNWIDDHSTLEEIRCSKPVSAAVRALRSAGALHRAMRLRKDMLVVVCETFNRMFNHNHDSLVSQAINCGLIKDLLNILGSRLDNVPNASACKAQVNYLNVAMMIFEDFYVKMIMFSTQDLP